MDYRDYELDLVFRVWRQSDLTPTVEYGDKYVHDTGRDSRHFLNHEASALSKLRLGFIQQFVPEGSKLVDIGCGLGSFVKACDNYYFSYGYEPFRYSKSLIEPLSLNEVIYDKWDVMTFFDVLEHFPYLTVPINLMSKARFVVISVPECHFPDNEQWFMNWKHRKPGEHLWHFNKGILCDFMKRFPNFRLITYSNFEDAIRTPSPYYSNILTGIFERNI